MKPMDREYIKQQCVAQRYLQGKLTPEEAEEFEVYLMEHPDALEQLELDSLMVKYLPEAAAQKVPAGFDWKRFWHVPLATGGATLAAGFVAVWLFAPVFFGSDKASFDFAQSQIIYVDHLRSANSDAPVITIPNKLDQQIVIVLSGAASEPPAADIQISRGGVRVATLPQIQPNDYGEWVFSFPTKTLERGEYQLEAVADGQALSRVILKL